MKRNNTFLFISCLRPSYGRDVCTVYQVWPERHEHASNAKDDLILPHFRSCSYWSCLPPVLVDLTSNFLSYCPIICHIIHHMSLLIKLLSIHSYLASILVRSSLKLLQLRQKLACLVACGVSMTLAWG